MLSRLLARVTPILHYPGTETGSHSPVDDGHEVDDPEAGPEHEVARGQDVEEDEEAGGHPPAPGVLSLSPVPGVSGSDSGVVTPAPVE